MVTAVGEARITSAANDGPERTASRSSASRPRTSPRTSVMRLSVPSSIPLEAETTIADSGTWGAAAVITPRTTWLGRAETTSEHRRAPPRYRRSRARNHQGAHLGGSACSPGAARSRQRAQSRTQSRTSRPLAERIGQSRAPRSAADHSGRGGHAHGLPPRSTIGFSSPRARRPMPPSDGSEDERTQERGQGHERPITRPAARAHGARPADEQSHGARERASDRSCAT